MHMMFYEIVCFSCKNIFRVYEGSENISDLKRNQKGHIVVMSVYKIQLEAIKNF